MRSVLGAISVALLLAGCQRDSETASPAGDAPSKPPVVLGNKAIKVKVTVAGEITADGQPVTLGELDSQFADLAKVDGQVWYHRENINGEPHPNALKVIELVIRHKLPIRISAKPDYSDSVDSKGISHPSE